MRRGQPLPRSPMPLVLSIGVGLVAVIAVVAVVPYLALQLKAIAMSYGVLSGVGVGMPTSLGGDSALWCALLLALFAILFGTRSIDASEHHHGLMLAIALESFIKLAAFVALAMYAWGHGPGLFAGLKLPVLSMGMSGDLDPAIAEGSTMVRVGTALFGARP